MGPGPKGEWCFSSMIFDANASIAPLEDDRKDDHVIAYVSGDVSSSNSTTINCDECLARNFGASVSTADIESMLADNPPNAIDLQIYSAGRSVALGNHTHFGAAIYAPSASCHGNPSNAQGYVYGAMLCNDIRQRVAGRSGSTSDSRTSVPASGASRASARSRAARRPSDPQV